MKNNTVTTLRLNVRKSASKESEVLRIVDRNDILEYTSVKNGWVRLKGDGYVMEDFIEVVRKKKVRVDNPRTSWTVVF